MSFTGHLCLCLRPDLAVNYKMLTILTVTGRNEIATVVFLGIAPSCCYLA